MGAPPEGDPSKPKIGPNSVQWRSPKQGTPINPIINLLLSTLKALVNKPGIVLRGSVVSSAGGLLLLMIEIPHDFVYQNPRNGGSRVYICIWVKAGFISSTGSAV